MPALTAAIVTRRPTDELPGAPEGGCAGWPAVGGAGEYGPAGKVLEPEVPEPGSGSVGFAPTPPTGSPQRPQNRPAWSGSPQFWQLDNRVPPPENRKVVVDGRRRSDRPDPHTGVFPRPAQALTRPDRPEVTEP